MIVKCGTQDDIFLVSWVQYIHQHNIRMLPAINVWTNLSSMEFKRCQVGMHVYTAGPNKAASFVQFS